MEQRRWNCKLLVNSTARHLDSSGSVPTPSVITYDTLVRAGVQCASAFVPTPDAPKTHATCSRGVRIVPDMALDDVHDDALSRYDAIVVPGGAKGAETISGNARVQGLVKGFYDAGKVVGMICAGSLAAPASKLPKDKITSHPSVRSQLEKGSLQPSCSSFATPYSTLLYHRL
jgi:protein DJ-1